MVLSDEESLNAIFQELADWEHQLKALDQDIPLIGKSRRHESFNKAVFQEICSP